MKVMNISWWDIQQAFLDMDFLTFIGQIVCFIPPVCSGDVFPKVALCYGKLQEFLYHTAGVAGSKDRVKRKKEPDMLSRWPSPTSGALRRQ